MAKKQIDSRPIYAKENLEEAVPYSGVFKRKARDIKDWGTSTEIVDPEGTAKPIEEVLRDYPDYEVYVDANGTPVKWTSKNKQTVSTETKGTGFDPNTKRTFPYADTNLDSSGRITYYDQYGNPIAKSDPIGEIPMKPSNDLFYIVAPELGLEDYVAGKGTQFLTKQISKGLSKGLNTGKAILQKRYLPFMTFKDKRNFLQKLHNDYENELLQTANLRLLKNYDALSKDYMLFPKRLDSSNQNVRFVSEKLAKRNPDMDGNLGINYDYNGSNDIVVRLNKGKQLYSLKDIKAVLTHELNHSSQSFLGNNRTLPFSFNRISDLISLDKATNSELIGDNIAPIRLPISDYNVNKDGNYGYGVPDIVYNSDENLYKGVEYPGMFIPLTDRWPDRTWHSDPNEVISEVASHIDFDTKGNKGKVFKELSDKDKNRIIKSISKTFDLDPIITKYMLEYASPKYLKHGGRISLEDNN